MEHSQEQVKRVVFVSVTNVGRSVTAEYLFRQIIEDMDLAGKISVSSAGVCNDEIIKTMPEMEHIWEEYGRPEVLWGNPAYPSTIAALAKRGIDASKHVSKPLTKEVAETADLIIPTSPAQKATITSVYPSTKGKVYTLDEINDTTTIFLIGIPDRNWKPVYKPDWPLKGSCDTGPYCEIIALVMEWVLKKECGKILSLLGIKRY